MDKLESGYSLIELMVSISMISFILSSTLLMNNFVAKSWRSHQSNLLLQQDLRASMDNIVGSLNSSREVISLDNIYLEDIDEGSNYSSIIYLDVEVKRRNLYYKDGTGLVWDDDANIISNRVNEARFKLINGRVLSIYLRGNEGENEFELRSGVRVAK